MAQKQNPQQLRTQTKYNYQENRVMPTLLNFITPLKPDSLFQVLGTLATQQI